MTNGYVVGFVTLLVIWGIAFLAARLFEQRGDRKRITKLAQWYIKLGSPTNDHEISQGFQYLGVFGFSPFPNDELLAYGRMARQNASGKEIVEVLRPLWRQHYKNCGPNYHRWNASRYGGNHIHDLP